MATLRVHTKPVSKYCADGLAMAVYLTLTHAGREHLLNSGHPVLYAPGEIDAADQIVPKNLLAPRVAALSDRYVIVADAVYEAHPERGSTPVAFETADFLEFAPCAPVPAAGDIIDIPDTLAEQLIHRWQPLECKAVCVPETVSLADVPGVRAQAVYSDGSTHLKPVVWDLSGVDASIPGTYRITGQVQTHEFAFPCATDTGDPVLLHWDGRWYFIATNDAKGAVGLYLRRAATPEALFEPGQYDMTIILDKDEEHGFIQTFWAPEFHVIGGKLCILFAVGGQVWGPQSQVMVCKPGADIFLPDSWELPVPVLRADGSPLYPGGITLDMTYLHADSGDYYVWSARRDCMGPNDSGSMLYIARMDPAVPNRITSEPMLLTRPLLGFENVSGTINNEGPYVLCVGDTVYVTYSGGASNSFSYCLGFMAADTHADLLNIASWKKAGAAVLHMNSLPDVWGPGHHSFFELDGDTYIAFHGETHIDSMTRCTGIHRVHIDAAGHPRFDLCAARDLPACMKQVEMTVTVD